MYDFTRHGIRWGYTFLITDSRLSEEQRYDLMYRATEMYLKEEPRQDFHDETLEYEGSIHTKSEYQCIGGMNGQRFDADVDVHELGKVSVRFLVSEQTIGSRTSISNN